MSPEERQLYYQEWYVKNKEKVRQNVTKWRKNNPEKYAEQKRVGHLKQKENPLYKEKQTQKRISWAINNRQKIILQTSKKRAKNLGLEFNLDLSDIVIPTHCPYLGIELTNIVGEGLIASNPSIDRIDPTKGYIKGNIEIISCKANVMKNNASQEELIVFAQEILRRYAHSSG